MKRIIPVLPLLLKNKKAGAGVAVAALAVWLMLGGGGIGLDRFWKEPRDLLVDRVEDARDTQRETAEEFRDALAEFKAVLGTEGGELEAKYRTLNTAFEGSREAAAKMSGRVERVVSASNRLLDEWRQELTEYSDPALRGLAQQQFDRTREQAATLIESMRMTEQRMQPVLASFQDQVLYLKHNLNLAAIASLEGEALVIETNVDALIEDMNRSIDEADALIRIILDRG